MMRKEDLLYAHPFDNRVLISAARIQAGGQQCFFEGWSGFIFSALYFNGDDLSAILQYEINFMILVEEVAGFDFKLSSKLLQTIVFSQRPFELIVRLQKDGTVVNVGHVLEESGVKYKKFN